MLTPRVARYPIKKVPAAKAAPASPPRLTLHTVKLSPEQLDRLEEMGDDRGWKFRTVEHAQFAFEAEELKFNLVGYKSGKLVVQGKGTEDFVRDVLEPQILGKAELGYEEVHHPDWFEPHAGCDEAGKGDFFGPVVAATVIADAAAVRAWRAAGVKDSKAIGDDMIEKLDRRIRETPGVVVRTSWCTMEKYNALMAKPGANLNKLLAWLHSRALADALAERRVPRGLLDQFSTKNLVAEYLKDADFQLDQRTKAESDPVVAAASVVARAEFVRQMNNLSDLAGETLFKGAGGHVRKQGEELVKRLGKEALGRFAKLHFRTAYQVLGLPVPEKKPFRKYGG